MRIGSLFSGYGGLCELAVAPALGGTVAWHCENDKDASLILAHHWPDTPNLGDITTVDWSQVEPVDVLTEGFPCQDLSHAGKRLGLRPGTRSGLWSHAAYAISQLRPRLVVIENVRGLLSAEAHGDLEPCAWCVGDGEGSPLRALGAVLGDLAGLGYDARWAGVRAADAGAPHGRFRVFIVAYPASDEGRQQHRDDGTAGHSESRRERCEQRVGRGEGADAWTPGGTDSSAADTGGVRREPGRPAGPGEAAGGWALGEPAGRGLLPTPRATDGIKGGPNQRGSSGDLMLPSAVTLLPTPAVNDMGDRPWRQRDRWGEYADAVARWEALTRPAPEPTQRSTKGTPQLSPVFSEWLMGLPAGHVTDVPGITRNAQLRALGNGVVPAQAALALSLLLGADTTTRRTA